MFKYVWIVMLVISAVFMLCATAYTLIKARPRNWRTGWTLSRYLLEWWIQWEYKYPLITKIVRKLLIALVFGLFISSCLWFIATTVL